MQKSLYAIVCELAVLQSATSIVFFALHFISMIQTCMYVHLYGHWYETKGINDLKFPIRNVMTITGNIIDFLSIQIFRFLKHILRLFQK